MQVVTRGERWIALWCVVLAVVLLGPALGDGPVLTYDMVWVPDLALHRDVLGLGTGLPRAVPSDAVVAVLDELVPGILLQKVVLLGLLVLAGYGAARLVRGPALARVAAAGIFEWNAFVVERLLVGHWPVLVGYALLPWVLLLGRRWRADGRLPMPLLVALPFASLSASAGLVTAVALVASARGSGRRRLLVLLLAAANAPWLVAGLAHASTATTDPAGAHAFALHDEGPVPGPLAALTLGGIWNAEVVPDSRTGALGWVTLVALGALCVAGARRWWRDDEHRDLLVCWAVGWVLASATWVAPGAVGWLGETVPGLGVLRDGGRVLGLCAPLLAVLVGHGLAELAARARVAAAAALLVALLLPVALLPDAALGVGGRIDPATYPDSWRQARTALAGADVEGDLLVLPLTAFRQPVWNHGRTVFDPLGRYLAHPYVASDVLVVSGRPVAGEDPRVAAAAEALAAPTPQARAERLLAAGIGAVVVDGEAPGATEVPEIAGTPLAGTGGLTVLTLDGEPTVSAAGWGSTLATGLGWAAYVSVLVTGLAGVVRNTVRRRRRC
ncbi:hypothetical protein [Nocardioides sp. LML1-1-1.1]|uniref:hypothetical protein n=1 Tax=Nocardioides sp. LML1-1-1.1 TaxID=3135248 RepID=UPI00343E8ABC